MNTDQIKRENEAMYDMTIMHDPPKAIGNCFQACVASLLGLPLAEVPHFCEPVRHWERRFHQWLAARDLFAVEASLKVPDSLFLSPRTMCILTGDSPRGRHAVIGRVTPGADGFEYVHDPHPERGYYAGKEPDQVMFIGRVVRDSALEAELNDARNKLAAVEKLTREREAANARIERVRGLKASNPPDSVPNWDWGQGFAHGYNAALADSRKAVE